MAAADALLDLSLVLVWMVAFALATLAFYLAKAIAAPLDVSIGPYHPFRSIQNAIENGIIEPLDDVRKKSDAEIARGLRGIVDALELFVGLTLLLGLGVYKALAYGWRAVILPILNQLGDAIAKESAHLVSEVARVDRSIAHAIASAEDYTDRELAAAAAAISSYAEHVALVAEHTAESYADDAVAKLRNAEDTAIAHAVDIADAAKTAGLAAAAKVETEAEAGIASARNAAEAGAATAVRDAESVAAHALAASEAAASTALEQVKSIALTAEHDLTDFEAYIKSLGLPALIAGATALATLVTVVLTETGLENQSCRGKVKNICATDPLAWASLLAGVAAVGVAFDLADVAKVAVALVDETDQLIGEFGSLSAAAIDDVGQVIGEAALRIAA